MEHEDEQELGSSTRFIPVEDTPGEMQHRQTNTLDLKTPVSLHFTLEDAKATTFEIPLSSYMVIGRKNSQHDSQVDIDLGPFDSHKYGVSRFHAIIMVVNNRISIKDFNSTNGTLLNDYSLQPMHSYRLRHGDKLSFGKFNMTVHYIYLGDKLG